MLNEQNAYFLSLGSDCTDTNLAPADSVSGCHLMTLFTGTLREQGMAKD